MDWFNIYTHLLPRSRAWALRPGSVLRQIVKGLTYFPNDVRREFDRIWLDIFPDTTRALTEWEQQWALPASTLTEAQRRSRLSAVWKATGGQSPKYLQDTLQAAGFPVFVHDWWEPATDPPVARNPLLWIRGDTAPLSGVNCGEAEAQAGEAFAVCGNTVVVRGYLLVNKISTTRNAYTSVAGDASMYAGEAEAVCGEYTGFIFDYVKYNVPVESDKWPFMFYVGGEVFGELADVPTVRRLEFETLVLKLASTHLWGGIFINYV